MSSLEDSLAWLWCALTLLAFVGIAIYSLRTRTMRHAEVERLRAEPVKYIFLLGAIASVICFLLWIVSGERLFGFWTVGTMIGFGIAAIVGNDLSARRTRN